jgi:hypothetical protein
VIIVYGGAIVQHATDMTHILCTIVSNHVYAYLPLQTILLKHVEQPNYDRFSSRVTMCVRYSLCNKIIILNDRRVPCRKAIELNVQCR